MEKTRKANAAKWFRLVEKFMSSDFDKQSFCEQEEVNAHTFHYWYKKYEQRDAGTSNGFVTLSSGPRGQSIYIRYRNGVELELPANTPVTQVLQLVHGHGC